MTKKKLQQKITEMIRESEKRCYNDHDKEIQKKPQKYLAPHPLDYNFDKCFFIYDNAKELHNEEAQTLIEFCNEELKQEAKKTNIDYQKVFYLSHIMELNRNELDKLTPMIKNDLLTIVKNYQLLPKLSIPQKLGLKISDTKKQEKINNKKGSFWILCDVFQFESEEYICKSHSLPW